MQACLAADRISGGHDSLVFIEQLYPKADHLASTLCLSVEHSNINVTLFSDKGEVFKPCLDSVSF